jgi:hypothetical protein
MMKYKKIYACLKCGREVKKSYNGLFYCICGYVSVIAEEVGERPVTCNDCKWCGVIFAPYDEDKPIKKVCPSEFLFNHPKPWKCPNFEPRLQ